MNIEDKAYFEEQPDAKEGDKVEIDITLSSGFLWQGTVEVVDANKNVCLGRMLTGLSKGKMIRFKQSDVVG